MATSLIEQAGREFEIVLLGRRVFLLEDRGAVLAGLKAARPDVAINAAAYTAVDQAEAEESLAVAINGEGAGHVAEAADRIGAPLLQLSTDYVFDGAFIARPARTIRQAREAPTGAPNCSAKGWSPSAAPTGSSCAPRGSSACTGRISSVRCFHLTRRGRSLGRRRPARQSDLRLNLAAALLAVAARVREDASPALRGVFHMTGSGEATWADFAEAIFVEVAACGHRLTRVKPITTTDYPRLRSVRRIRASTMKS